MAPRPEGTDGSDHLFREVIAERYKRIAKARRHAPYLLAATFVMACLKTTWSTVSFLEGKPPAVYVITMAVNALVMLILYFKGNIGGPRETLKMLKLYSVSCMLLMVQQILSAYPYYMIWPEDDKLSSLMVRYAKRTGEFDPEWMSRLANNTEQAIDMFLAIAALFNALNIHGMTADKMQDNREKKRAEREAQKKSK